MARPRRRRRRLRSCFAIALLGLLAAGGLVAVGLWAWKGLHQPYRGFLEEERLVLIKPGTGATAILERLGEEGVLEHPELARLYLIYGLDDPPLQAGEYRFAGAATVPEVLAKLIDGEVLTHKVTVIEGLTREETAATLAEQGFGDEAAFLRATADPSRISDLDPEALNLEGYLYPDTYHFARGTSEEEIIRTLVGHFRDHYEETLAPLLAAAAPEATSAEPASPEAEPENLDPLVGDAVRGPRTQVESLRELVTLASIIEKEARLDTERPVISSVYNNRLRRGIALYADPTVIFAKKLEGTWDGNLRRPDLAMDSPYNTYRYPGLPPGPIASPAIASLVAAAEPAETPYLYFVSRNDGSHVFARTLTEHNRNVDRWQRRYWRERWAREGR